MAYEMKFLVHISVPRFKFALRLQKRLYKTRLAKNVDLIVKDPIEDGETSILVVEALYTKRNKIIEMIEIIGNSCAHLRETRVIKLEDIPVPIK